jgi:hypothetical protein
MRRHLVLLALVACTGCLQSEYSTTLFPDGSGKIAIRLAVKKALIEATDTAADIEHLTDPEKLAGISTGVAAWAVSGPLEQGEWIHFSTVAYFEDINAVSLGRKTEIGVPWIDFRYETTADGQSLVLMDRIREAVLSRNDDDRSGAGREQTAAIWQLLKPLAADMRTSFSVTVPGPIVEAPAFLQTSGRQASFVVEGAQLFSWNDDPRAFASRLREIAAGPPLRIVWKETTVTAVERVAFQHELAAARDAWRRALDGVPARRDPARPDPPR